MEGGRKGACRKSSMSPSPPMAWSSWREGRHDSAGVERRSGRVGGGEGEQNVTSAEGVRLEERDKTEIDELVQVRSFNWTADARIVSLPE